jgi:hypothetical protein
VGSFECGSIIRTITSHTDNLAERAKGFNKDLLIFRGRPGRDLETGDDLDTFVWAESAENRTFQDDTTICVDAALSDDRASGEDVVSSTHLDGYTGVVAVGDGIADTRTKGIFDTGDGHQSHVVSEFLV